MIPRLTPQFAATSLFLLFSVSAQAHEVSGGSYDSDATNVVPLRFIVEEKGPVRAAKAIKHELGLQVSGQGYWKFAPARELVPIPATISTVTNAHGTLIVDRATGIVYWGLQKVGWIGFSNKLSASWIVPGDPVFAKGNLHGADILPRAGKPPRV